MRVGLRIAGTDRVPGRVSRGFLAWRQRLGGSLRPGARRPAAPKPALGAVPHCRWLLPLLLGAAAIAGAAGRPVEGPALVPDPGRALHDSRGGGARAMRIDSAILNERRRIDIVTPASFAGTGPERRFPVIVVLDGESMLAPAAAVIDELSRHGLIPESILVAVENADADRSRLRDLTPPGLSVSGSGLAEGGDRFLDFIEGELLPAVDRELRGGLPRTLIGHSSGGVLATHAAATRPSFRAVIAIDAPIHLDRCWLSRKLLERASVKPGALRFAYYGARFPWPDTEWSALLRAAPPSWRLHRESLRNEGHETAFLLAAYLGLREVFVDYSRLAAPVAPTTRILPYYEALGAELGAKQVPPRIVLRNAVEDLLMEGRGRAARDAYEILASGYGAPADHGELLAQIADSESRPPPSETVEALLATPFPTPDEARDYLGEWMGDLHLVKGQAGAGQTVLRIREDSGRVVAEVENPAAPPEFRIRKLDHLRITPTGLVFGFMNGMRPRGVVLHEGTRRGDTLSGTQRWGGIRFRYPEGMEPPELVFSFTRARR